MTAESQNEEPFQDGRGDRNLRIQGSVGESSIVAGDQNTIQHINVFSPIQIRAAILQPAQPINKQEYRWRQVLVDNVKYYWLEGVLKKSLHNQALIELGLEERSQAVASPLRGVGEFPDEPGRTFPDGTQATAIFDELGAGRTLLILGEPGAGKTTTLLKLAQSLLERIGDDLSQPIPVILNLSSWAKKRQSIAEWLVQDLYETFQVSKSMGRTWIEEEQLILCLDGLDEVESQHRDDCVQTLNQFIQDHGRTEIVVCSRILDYESLSERLRLRSAIYVQPLTFKQISHYLEQAGEQLTALRTVLAQNSDIRGFASSPLILSIMSLAYRDCPLEQFPKLTSIDVFRQRLFETYIERMFQRRGPTLQYSHMQTNYWLGWIAQRMVQTSQTVFLIERIQPSWLQTRIQRIRYWMTITLGEALVVTLGLTVSLVLLELLTGLPRGLFLGLLTSLRLGITGGLITAVFWGTVSGIGTVLNRRSSVGFLADIKTVETLRWSWQEAKKSSHSGLSVILIVGLIAGLVSGLMLGLTIFDSNVWSNQLGSVVIIKIILLPFVVLLSGFSVSSVIVLFLVPLTAVITGLLGGFKGPEVQKRGKPNQGIWLSFRNALVLTLSISIASGIISGLSTLAISLPAKLTSETAKQLMLSLFDGVRFGLFWGLILGNISGFFYGGIVCIRHLALRLVLYQTGDAPWNYAHFLDYAAERLFLQKVGGGYIFIHRMLLEYFAQMKLDPARKNNDPNLRI